MRMRDSILSCRSCSISLLRTLQDLQHRKKKKQIRLLKHVEFGKMRRTNQSRKPCAEPIATNSKHNKVRYIGLTGVANLTGQKKDAESNIYDK